MMSRLNFPQRSQGHRVTTVQNYDIEQRLTYQQLLNLNNDLRKENMHLRNIANRLGDELKLVHTQFDIRPRDENTQLYEAIGTHPIMNQFEGTLIPLLDCYDNKIMEFEQGFEKINDEYFMLEKRFEEVCRENDSLKMQLTESIKELIDLYRDGVPEGTHSDFSQLILHQVNQQQQVLSEENTLLERNLQNSKAEAARAISQAQVMQAKLAQVKQQVRELEVLNRQLKAENNKHKQNSIEQEIKVNELEIQKKRLQQAHERAQSQNTHLNKEKQMYKIKLDELRMQVEKQNSLSTIDDGSSGKVIQRLQTQVALLEAEKMPQDSHKRLNKLQKQFQELKKQKFRIKESLQASRMREDQLNQTIHKLRETISILETEKTALELNENKQTKTLENLTEKVKKQSLSLKKQNQKQMKRIEFEYTHTISAHQKKIDQLQQELDKAQFQCKRLQKQNSLKPMSPRQMKPTRDGDREMVRMKEKLAMSQDVFREQVHIFENDLAFMKREADMRNEEIGRKGEENRTLQREIATLRNQHNDAIRQKKQLLSEFQKVREDYSSNLASKEIIFDEKIKQVKSLLQQQEKKRKGERERAQEATKQYRKILQEIKGTYEQRIRELEGQVSEVRYRNQTTTVWQ